MSTKDEVRDQVSKAYARAVSAPAPRGGCCSGAGVLVKGAVASLAGYSSEELGDVPEDAATNSFGCGNPVAMSGIVEGETVLDLGSGAGIDLVLASRRVGPRGRVIGVDMTDEMIDRARANVRAAGLVNVEIRKGIIEALPVEDSSVDWVISNCVINLSPEKHRVFAEIARVLKPGGRMLVSDIVAQDLPDWIRKNADMYSSCVAGAIGEDEYVQGLHAAGLVDVEVKERFVYDASQLRAFLASEEGTEGQACCGGGPGIDPALVDRVLSQVAGQIWSAKVFGRKPGA